MFSTQRPVTRSFDVYFDLCQNKRWVNKREAGDLRHNRAHYDVIVMWVVFIQYLAVFGFGALQGVFSDFQIIPLNSSPDNIQLEPETGHIWIGCSPVIWRLFAHEDNCETPAPSQVWILLQCPLSPDACHQTHCFNTRDPFPDISIPIIKIRRSWYRLISIMGNNLFICILSSNSIHDDFVNIYIQCVSIDLGKAAADLGMGRFWQLGKLLPHFFAYHFIPILKFMFFEPDLAAHCIEYKIQCWHEIKLDIIGQNFPVACYQLRIKDYSLFILRC